MMISTKGRYALRVMIDLAENSHGEYITLNDIAQRQNISEKYLEGIVAALSKKNLVDALRGKGGGYRMNRPAEEYIVADILKATEGSLAPVACLEKEDYDCPRSGECRTIGMWTDLYHLIDSFFNGITIADLMQSSQQFPQ